MTDNDLSGTADVAFLAWDIFGDVYIGAHSRRRERPRQLPRHPATFVNRTADYSSLQTVPGDGIFVISGPMGVGKSALARVWMHRISDRYPDGQLYAHLHGQPGEAPVNRVLEDWLCALGVAPEHVPVRLEAKAAEFRSRTTSRRLAVLVDDAAENSPVYHMFPAGGSLLVITSRFPRTDLRVSGAKLLGLDRLDEPSAMELLTLLAGADRIEPEIDAARALVDACDGMPLGLVVTGAFLATTGAAGESDRPQ